MKIVSWNVNGLRANYKKGFLNWFERTKADFCCLQEVRARKEELPGELLQIKGFFCFLNSAKKPGYSGTAIYSRKQPVKVIRELGVHKFDEEARMLRIDLDDLILINFYLPHGGRTKENLPYKMKVYEAALLCLERIKNKKVIVTGDFNVAHREIDLARPADNRNNVMFTGQERAQIGKIVEMGYIDSFRHFNKQGGNYTWWPYFNNARERNLGWRIDYCFVSKPLVGSLERAFIQKDVFGSDHCPVGVELK